MAFARRISAIFACKMPNDPSDSDITWLLAKAFDRAWDQYFVPGRITIAADVGRKQLAKRLVELAREGERNESDLAAGGLAHLVFFNSSAR